MQTTDTVHPADRENLSGDNEAGGNTAVLVENSPAEEAPPQAGCPNCSAASYSPATWCKSCGFYALLGRCIELDDWDRDGTEIETRSEPTATWLKIPAWAWQLSASIVSVAGLTLAGRYFTPEDSSPRVTWSLCQVFGGLTAFLAAHFRVAQVALSQDKSLQLSDVIMTPVKVWITACLDFQRLSHWVAVGLAGIWATVLAHLLLGVPYNSLFTHEEAPKKEEVKKAAPAVAKVAGSGKKNMTMEEAMKEFGDKSGANSMKGDGAAASLKNANDPEKDKPAIHKLDCLIVGYQPGGEGGGPIAGLVVAVKADGKWKVVGMVTNGLTPEIQRELSAAVKSLHREQPFVECTYSANWLEPILRCRVEAEIPPGQTEPQNLKFIELQ
jgi:hypothetical protein